MKFIHIVFAVVLSTFVSVSHAGILKLIVENGILMGADNVLVKGFDYSGGLYNVRFLDGTCAELFSGCDENSDFFPGSMNIVGLDYAVEALGDYVFVDGVEGQFDSDSRLTNGCVRVERKKRCRVNMPFDHGYNPDGSDYLRAFSGTNANSDEVRFDGVCVAGFCIVRWVAKSEGFFEGVARSEFTRESRNVGGLECSH